MSDDDRIKRLETLLAIEQARVRALEAFVLSSIIASDDRMVGFAEQTIGIVQEEAREAAKHRPELALAFLDDLIDNLRAALETGGA